MLSFFPVRFLAFFLAILGTVVCLVLGMTVAAAWYVAALVCLLLTLIGIHDLVQSRHSVKRNYPVIGNLRFLLEFIRPELRQYFIESDTDTLPFSRAQRSIVYQRAKQQIDKRPFGTIENVYSDDYEWVNHSMMPSHIPDRNFRIAVGQGQCSQPYDISVFNISAMSFGALSANAIRSLNRGAKAGGFAHDTGEGGISSYHLEAGGDLIWNIGSGYFGCRDENGHFSDSAFAQKATLPNIKMIEIKLSQGAKPGHGGILPGAKVTAEIAEVRGVTPGVDCDSPAAHSAFSTPVELLLFVQRLRKLSGGKPVGFKLCIGHPWEWFAIVKAMLETGITPDFIVVDGSEGGTGAAPVEFVDHMGVPLKEALRLVHNALVGAGLRERIKIGASGKIISAFDILRTLALGADWCNSARGFMFAVGCIQAQACHTGKCPSGVATQDPSRQRAIVVMDKADRVTHFHRNTVHALAELLQAAGLTHPEQLRAHHVVRRISSSEVKVLSAIYPELEKGDLLKGNYRLKIFEICWPLAQAHSFQPARSIDLVASEVNTGYQAADKPAEKDASIHKALQPL